MTKLSTHIPVKYIKQSKKLQEINNEKAKKECWNKFKIKYYPIITIANIIDNAEMLFGNYEGGCRRCHPNGINEYAERIIYLCFQNKSINEISKYIIENIK